MTFKSVKQPYFLLVDVSADRSKLLGGGIWLIAIQFLEMFCVAFWIGVYTTQEFLFSIIVTSCKSSSLVTGVSRWFLWANVTIGQIKLVPGTKVEVKVFVFSIWLAKEDLTYLKQPYLRKGILLSTFKLHMRLYVRWRKVLKGSGRKSVFFCLFVCLFI